MVNFNIKQVTDFFGFELRNTRLHQVSGSPSSPAAGVFWYDTAAGVFKYQNASIAIDPLARANHSGSQVSSTISDLAAVVQAYRLNQFAAPTADTSIGGFKLTSLATGIAGTDAVNLTQLNAAISTAMAGVSWKLVARLATTANDTLSGLAARDGITPVAGDRVLVKNQTTAANNGIYAAAAGAWTRTTDANTAALLLGGTLIAVDQGTVNTDTVWMLAGDVVTLGTTVQNWVPYGAGTTYVAGNGLTLTSNSFAVTPKASGGIIVDGTGVSVDYTSAMKRKVVTGYVGTTGTDITINHAFALAFKEDLLVQVFEVATGEVKVGVSPVDINNVILSFGTTPTASQYRYCIMGLS